MFKGLTCVILFASASACTVASGLMPTPMEPHQRSGGAFLSFADDTLSVKRQEPHLSETSSPASFLTPGTPFALSVDAPLTRTDVERFFSAGIRYLGIRGKKTYAFTLQPFSDTERVQSELSKCSKVRGAAPIGVEQRATNEVLTALARGWRPQAIHAVFWPHAMAGEVRALLGSAATAMRLPQEDDAPIREACSAEYVAYEADIRALLTSPVLGHLALIHPPVFQSLESRELSGATELENVYGVDGSGEYVGVWDDGNPFNPDLLEISVSDPLSSDRRANWLPGIIVEEPSSHGAHATHVCGVIAANGASNSAGRGFAPGCAIVSYHASSSVAERRECRHKYYHAIDNHSYIPARFNSGNTYELDIDNRDLNFMAAFAAGNDGGYGVIGTDLSKNTIIVGATDANGDIAGFSSKGPIGTSNRVAPDISAMGAHILAATVNGGYGYVDGTSFSSPSVAGMYALLSQLHKERCERLPIPADVGKLVLVHTAHDRGTPGPDYAYGFGVADVKAAGDLLVADAADIGSRLIRGYVGNGDLKEYTIPVSAGDPMLKVTVHWLDTGALSDTTMAVVNNIDATLIAPDGTEHFPFSLNASDELAEATASGPTEDDNIEQFVIENPEAGNWTLQVLGKFIVDIDDNVQGFVGASDHPVSRRVERFVNQNAPAEGVDVPDNSMTGVSVEFEVGTAAYVEDVHLYLDILHDRRGDLEVELFAPDGTSATLEQSDSETRQDICTIFPDLRSRDGNVEAFKRKVATGMWRLEVRDVRAGSTGTIRAAALELEYAKIVELVIDPASEQQLQAGDQVTFTATLVDTFGNHIDVLPNWSLSSPAGGTMTSAGLLTAGDVPGNYLVTATDPVESTSAEVAFVVLPPPDQNDSSSGGCTLQARGWFNGVPPLIILALMGMLWIFCRKFVSPATARSK